MTPVLGQRLRAERAFERLYQRHVGDVYRYSLAILRNPSDAEDVTQTTFLNAYRAYRSGERPDSPRAWLIAIAHNVCRQRFRTASRRVQEVAYEDTVAEASVPDPEAPSAEEIQRALGQLAFNQRAALVMRELEGRSYAEIAELLEVSTSAVETLLFRARRALREQLEGSISCAEAEVAISKQLDRKLSRAERGTLRAHLRECAECATLARKQRAQRSAIRALGVLPLPSSLAVWGGGTAATGTAIGGSVALKAAAVVAAGTVAVGVGREAATRIPVVSERAEPAAASAEPRPAPPHVLARRPRGLAAGRGARSGAAGRDREREREAEREGDVRAAGSRGVLRARGAEAEDDEAAELPGRRREGQGEVRARPGLEAAGHGRRGQSKPKQKPKATHAKPSKAKVVPAKPPTASPRSPSRRRSRAATTRAAAARADRVVPPPVASADGNGGSGTMSIVNRRNAIMGWAVWTVGKQVMKQKAKSAVDARAGRAGAATGRRSRSARSPRPPRRRCSSGVGARTAATPASPWGRVARVTGQGTQRLLRAALSELQPYEPGKPVEEVQRELGLERVVKLASNEGPFGPFPRALEANAAVAGELNRYPDGGAYRLRTALAERHGVAFEEVALGAGADGVIDCVTQATLDPGDELVCCWPSFPSYVIYSRRLAATPVLVPLRDAALRPGRDPRRRSRRGRSSSASRTRTTRPAPRTAATSCCGSSTASPSTC